VLATRGGVTLDQWLSTLPFAAVGAAAFLGGLRIRNHVNASTFRSWVKRGLFVIALVLLLQDIYERV
jgi:hypothetical protein